MGEVGARTGDALASRTHRQNTNLDAAKRGAVPAAHGFVSGNGDHPVAAIVYETVPHGGSVAVPPRQDVHRVRVPEHHGAAQAGRNHKAVTIRCGSLSFFGQVGDEIEQTSVVEGGKKAYP